MKWKIGQSMTACGYSIKKYNFWHLSIAIWQKFCFCSTEQKGLVTKGCIIEKRERIENSASCTDRGRSAKRMATKTGFWPIMWAEYFPFTWPHFPRPVWKKKHFPLYRSLRKITHNSHLPKVTISHSKTPNDHLEDEKREIIKRLISRTLDTVHSRGKRIPLLP